jgi:hypothetical protein
MDPKNLVKNEGASLSSILPQRGKIHLGKRDFEGFVGQAKPRLARRRTNRLEPSGRKPGEHGIVSHTSTRMLAHLG